MKMTIREIKEKGEPKDKVKFSAVIKNVYDAKDATPAPGSKSKVVSRQNVMVEDASDTMKVIISHYSKSTEYKNDIIGKEVEVDGTLTEWEGKINIFGKLVFKEGEAPAETATVEKPKGASVPTTIPVGIKIREEALKRAMEFWTARIGDKMEEAKIIKTANVFYLYLTGKADIAKVQTKVQKEEGQEKEEKSEIEKEGEEIEKEEKISAEKIILINKIMALKESQHIDEEIFKGYCIDKDIKTLTIEKLEEIKKKLSEQTEEIPF